MSLSGKVSRTFEFLRVFGAAKKNPTNFFKIKNSCPCAIQNQNGEYVSTFPNSKTQWAYGAKM